MLLLRRLGTFGSFYAHVIAQNGHSQSPSDSSRKHWTPPVSIARLILYFQRNSKELTGCHTRNGEFVVISGCLKPFGFGPAAKAPRATIIYRWSSFDDCCYIRYAIQFADCRCICTHFIWLTRDLSGALSRYALPMDAKNLAASCIFLCLSWHVSTLECAYVRPLLRKLCPHPGCVCQWVRICVHLHERNHFVHSTNCIARTHS